MSATGEIDPVELQKAIARIRAYVLKYAEKGPLRLNPDEEIVNTIIEGLARNLVMSGRRYCPCKIVVGNPQEDRKIICPCATHRQEIEEDGMCHCGLFVGEETE